MKRRPYGCVTGIALLFGLLTVLLIGVAALATGNGIFSPGSLNSEKGEVLGGVTSHADLGAACDACHAQAWSPDRMADRCLVCHQSIRIELDGGTGLHGLFASADGCRGCHTEHLGATAGLTIANPVGFPHERTGFALDAHPVAQRLDGFDCAACHPASLTVFATGTCLACHEQRDAGYMTEHVDTFGAECRSCHDGVDTYGADFGHAAWVLEGTHATASCAACHAGATTIEALAATPTTCVACHAAQDIHEGRLGSDCASCHTAATWQGAQDDFDHGLAEFALAGKHTGVACLACHLDRRWTGIGTTCEACHAADDPHDGQFVQPCASCHTSAAWTPTTFDHSATRFKLVFAHAKPACAECHAKGQFANTPTTCIGCHRADDRHQGNLGTRCEACHKATTWGTTTFTHDQARFRLTGAHASALCVRCHATLTEYRGTPTTCYACHKADDEHKGKFGTDCGACHGTRSWSGATVDHSRTAFPLTGVHRSVSCGSCHKNNVFSGTPTACSACHKKPSTHQPDAFSSCKQCHSTAAWKPATFNAAHSFPMTHRNAGGICTRCHVGSWAVYTCSRCHSDAKMNEHHKEVPNFSLTTCVKCHPKGRGD